ncbi:NUDIX domain-containing protein [Candidatus Pacearchaeota archaeon]|nr:NUDIX domain-containing protein [Candidatus Pacearchaeota archaeon]
MKYRKGVFIIVYRKEKDKIIYLLLKRRLHWKGWEFPKGGVEDREGFIKAVKRELKEETGLKIKNLRDMKIKGKFDYSKELEDRKGIKGMTWKLFLAEAGSGKVKIDRKEHSDYSWEEFSIAGKMLKWANQKKCLSIMNKFLNT